MLTDPNNPMTDKTDKLAYPGFSWVLADELAAMPLPRDIDDQASFLAQQGIRLLVSLTEEAADANVLAAHGIQQLHIPVVDFTAPTQEQCRAFVAAVQEARRQGQPVGVHCTAGMGRTGTMLATIFVAEGMQAEAAMAEVRRLRPGSIETAAQEQAIRTFAGDLHGE